MSEEGAVMSLGNVAGGEGGEGGDVEEGVRTVFAGIQATFQEEVDVREKIRSVVRDLEQSAREIFTSLQAVHKCPIKDIPEVCSKSRALFQPACDHVRLLQDIVPSNCYYRYHDHWKFVFQRLSFLCSLLIYLESQKLATRDNVAVILGVHTKQTEGFHIDLDDFLMGLLLMANELSRLAVNSVIHGDYQRPFHISAFVSDMSAGFRLLNLKNDALRRKFDALKYDVKKIEEVVYDISIRGLQPQS